MEHVLQFGEEDRRGVMPRGLPFGQILNGTEGGYMGGMSGRRSSLLKTRAMVMAGTYEWTILTEFTKSPRLLEVFIRRLAESRCRSLGGHRKEGYEGSKGLRD